MLVLHRTVLPETPLSPHAFPNHSPQYIAKYLWWDTQLSQNACVCGAAVYSVLLLPKSRQIWAYVRGLGFGGGACNYFSGPLFFCCDLFLLTTLPASCRQVFWELCDISSRFVDHEKSGRVLRTMQHLAVLPIFTPVDPVFKPKSIS